MQNSKKSVYKIPCGATDLGENSRPLQIRINENKDFIWK